MLALEIGSFYWHNKVVIKCIIQAAVILSALRQELLPSSTKTSGNRSSLGVDKRLLSIDLIPIWYLYNKDIKYGRLTNKTSLIRQTDMGEASALSMTTLLVQSYHIWYWQCDIGCEERDSATMPASDTLIKAHQASPSAPVTQYVKNNNWTKI